jgi:hypothetical protein
MSVHISQSDPGDAFNHFWKIMEGMLDNLSQPVAFATAPLGPDTRPLRRDGSSGSDTDHEDTKYARKFGLGGLGRRDGANGHSGNVGYTKEGVIDLGDEFEEETFSVEGLVTLE